MEMFNYKIEIKDSEIQELLLDWGFQVQSVRKIFYRIFPDKKKFIRENIPEKILRKKLCWKDEKEFTDLETRIKKFYNDECVEKKPTEEDPLYRDNHFNDFYNYLTVNPRLMWCTDYLEERNIDYYLTHLHTQKYKIKTRFRIEVIRKLKEHLKTPQGYDIVRYC